MNGLYPIIRRVRRPLVPLVEGAAGGADAKPAQTIKAPQTELRVVAEQNKPNDGTSSDNPVER